MGVPEQSRDRMLLCFTKIPLAVCEAWSVRGEDGGRDP